MTKQTPDKRTEEKKEEEFDKHFKKLATEIADQLNNHYETKFVPKYGDILNPHKKH
tara:strand:- start:59 stop:226 length:168 start_codon:yes stop_codon:yes gene_type:complete